MIEPKTSLGMVGLDPMRVPAPARTALRGDDRFARELAERFTADVEPAPRVDSRMPSAERVDAEIEPGSQPPAEPPGPPPAAEPQAATPAERGSAAAPAAAAPLAAAEPGEQRSPAPGRDGQPPATLETARPAAAATALPGPAAGPALSSQPSPAAGGALATVAAASGGRQPAAPAATARGAAEPLARTTTTEAAAGYRRADPAAAQRFESVRDSVLKQIAFRLQDGAGEVHMRLQPPELGGLDLQLTVDAAGKARLILATERPELAALLGQSLTELRAALGAHGITITGAEVTSREQRDQRAPHRPAGDAAVADEPAEPAHAAGPDRRHPIHRVLDRGLDFWA